MNAVAQNRIKAGVIKNYSNNVESFQELMERKKNLSFM